MILVNILSHAWLGDKGQENVFLVWVEYDDIRNAHILKVSLLSAFLHVLSEMSSMMFS